MKIKPKRKQAPQNEALHSFGLAGPAAETLLVKFLPPTHPLQVLIFLWTMYMLISSEREVHGSYLLTEADRGRSDRWVGMGTGREGPWVSEQSPRTGGV